MGHDVPSYTKVLVGEVLPRQETPVIISKEFTRECGRAYKEVVDLNGGHDPLNNHALMYNVMDPWSKASDLPKRYTAGSLSSGSEAAQPNKALHLPVRSS